MSRHAVFLGALLLISCSGGSSSCLSCGGNYQFPQNDPSRPDAIVQDEVARARITQAFIDFIQPLLPDLLAGALGSGSGTGGVVTIPLGDFNDIIDVSVAGFGLIGLDIRGAEAKLYPADFQPCVPPQTSGCLLFAFERPNGVRIRVENLRLGLRLNLDAELVGSDSRCPVFGDLEPQDVVARFDLDILIEPGVGPDPDRNLDIDVTIEDIALQGFGIDVAGRSVYCGLAPCQDCAVSVAGNCLDPGGRCNECVLVCGGVVNALASVSSAIIGWLEPLLNRLIKPVIDNFVQDALANVNGTPAKIEQQIDLVATTGMALFKGANPFGILLAPEVGKFPVIDRGTGDGMEITLSGGAEAELADCVAGLPPFSMPKSPVPVLGGTDKQGRPYHLGFTIAAAYVNQIFYAFHRSGSLCIKVSSEDVRELTGGAFSLNASLLSLLASDLSQLAKDKAPVFMQFKPKDPPHFELGSGEVIGQDAMGNDVVDPLLKFKIDDIGLAFYVLIHDRYVRIFEVTMDVDVGANIVVLPDNTLEVAITKLDIGSFEEVFNELLPNADFATVLPSIIDLAFSALLSQELKFPIDLSDSVSSALGGAPIYMRVNEIFREGAMNDYLTLTMTFTSSVPAGALSLAARTVAAPHEENLLHEREGRLMKATGALRLDVGRGLPYTTQRALEYQVRVDNGFWHDPRPARPDDTLVLQDPKLQLPGRHMVDVRARYADDYKTLDPRHVSFEVVVDPTEPGLRAEVQNEAVVVVVSDDIALPSELQLRARFGQGPWFDLELEPTGKDEATARVPLERAGAASQLELIARDGVGNETAPAVVRVGYNLGEAGQADTGCACHELGVMHHHGERDLVVILLLFGLAALLRFGFRSR
jgi:hypothetical protein